jgi:Tfp pilus assembly protein PilF
VRDPFVLCHRPARPGTLPAALTALLAIGCVMAAVPPGAQAAGTPTPPAPFRAAYVPADDAEVLQEVPAASDPAVARMLALRAQQGQAPENLAAAISLAGAYIDYGRQIGDAHYAGYAEAVVARWLARSEPPASALLTEATILQYRHQFPEAREFLRRTLRRDPADAQAWLTQATLDMVQGDYAQAGKDCVKVTATAGFDWGLACSGNLRLYTGGARQSLALLEQARATSAGASPSYLAWTAGLMAEAAERLGDWPQAESHYREALNALPQDNFLLVAYADFLLDRGRPREVLALLADHTQSDTAFLRIALAKSTLQSEDAPRYTWIMAARFAALALRGSDYFGREQARFALELQHDPVAALDIARRNWQVQREPWDTRLLLAAALAAGQPQAAREALDFLQAAKLEDPLIAPLAARVRAALPPTQARVAASEAAR